MLRAARLVVLLTLAAPCARAGAAPPASSLPRPASGPAIADYVRARLAEAKGDGEGAIEALRHALVHDPESPQLRISYAEALARGGRLDAAEGEARRALEAAPGGAAAADAHLVLGKVLASAGRSEAAERELEAAARIELQRARGATTTDGDRLVDPEPWRALSRVRLARDDVTGALAACDQLAPLDRAAAAAALRDGAARLLDAGNAPAAEPLVRRALELTAGDAAGWKLLARVQQEQHRMGEARASIQRALQVDPADGEALLAAGQLALEEGDATAARGWFRQLLRVAPDEADAQVRVAVAWIEARQPADALEVARGDAPELLYVRGVALARLHRWADAAETLQRIEPSAGEIYPGARAMLAHVLSRAGKPAEALRSLRRALERDPQDPALLFALGEAYDRAGNREEALAQMRAVLALKPDHADALNYLGYAYAERGERLDEAEALLRHALQLEPDNAYFLDSLGWILVKRGDAPGAVEALERAASLAPELTILDHLGDAYRLAQRTADAASAYRRALQAGEGDDDEPGQSGASRRASLERKLEELGVRATRAANLR